jgi:hypothetical protein
METGRRRTSPLEFYATGKRRVNKINAENGSSWAYRPTDSNSWERTPREEASEKSLMATKSISGNVRIWRLECSDLKGSNSIVVSAILSGSAVLSEQTVGCRSPWLALPHAIDSVPFGDGPPTSYILIQHPIIYNFDGCLLRLARVGLGFRFAIITSQNVPRTLATDRRRF